MSVGVVDINTGLQWQDFNDAPEQVDISAAAIDVDILKKALLCRLPIALAYLFPKGQIRGKQFVIGDLEGNKGKSLIVELEGDKTGMWKDFATGEGGDIFHLWASAHNLDIKHNFSQVMKDIAHWLGEPANHRTPSHSQQFCTNDLGHHTARWDYKNGDGRLIACVYRYDTASGKEYRPWDVKAQKTRAPNVRPLYNQPEMKDADTIVLVEGEKCADALMAEGLIATTAMFGSNAPIDKTDWSPLIGKNVVVWPDHDEAGQRYANAVIEKLKTLAVKGIRKVTIPKGKPNKWDAADAIVENEDVEGLVSHSEMIKPSNDIVGVQLADWLAIDRFNGEPKQRSWLVEGVFPMAQAALLAASGGVGKSFLLLQLAREIASFDGFSATAPNLFGGALKASGAAVYITAEDDTIEVHSRLQSLGSIPRRLYIVPLPDAGGAKPLFAPDPMTKAPSVTLVWQSLARQLKKISGLKLVVLDPLQPLCSLDLNVPENAQFVCSQLSSLAAETGASVIISHHFAKREAATPEQAREAIRGTGGLVDGVRAVYALWHPKLDQAQSICKTLNIPYQRGLVVSGGIVKANGSANLNVTSFVRESCGLLKDRSADLSSKTRGEEDILMDFTSVIAEAAVAGKPYTKTGSNGVYERRFEFPEAFHGIGKHKLSGWVDRLLADGELVAAMAEGSKVVKWLDIPSGPVANGEAVFTAGHIQRASPGRTKIRPGFGHRFEYE